MISTNKTQQVLFLILMLWCISVPSIAQFDQAEIQYGVYEKENGALKFTQQANLRIEEEAAWFSLDSSEECTWISQFDFEQRHLIEFYGDSIALLPQRSEATALFVDSTPEQKSILGYDCHLIKAKWADFEVDAWVYKDTKYGFVPYLKRPGIALEYIIRSEGFFERKYVAEHIQPLGKDSKEMPPIEAYESMTMDQLNARLVERLKPELTHAPSFEHKDLEGKPISIDGTPNQLLVINFWYTQCPPCIKEIPSLNQIKGKFADKAVDFWAITFDDTALVQSFLKNHPFDYRIVPEAISVITEFGINVYPSSLVIDQQGKIVKTYMGGDENTLEELEAFIQQALHLQDDGKSN